jgi:hypothetical protein
MQTSSGTTAPTTDAPVKQKQRMDTRTKIAILLIVIGLLGLLGVIWDTTARPRLNASGIRVTGQVTGYVERDQTVGGVNRRPATEEIYFMTFTYEAQGGSYNGTWQVPDQSWIEKMPSGTQIAISYPAGRPSLGQPVGEPFDSTSKTQDNDFLSLVLTIIFQGFLPIVMIAIGIYLLRNDLRGRLMLDSRRRIST